MYVSLVVQGSGTLLVRLYKDAGTPSNDCSCCKNYMDIGTMPIQSVPHPFGDHFRHHLGVMSEVISEIAPPSSRI